MAYEPIAIVGQACVLPGALSPAALWQAVRSGKDLLGRAPENYWRLDPRRVLDSDGPERVHTDRGGYVAGFEEIFDASGYALAEDRIRGLDPLFQWLLHCGREALKDASLPMVPEAAGLIVGNLSYPSQALVKLVEAVLLDPDAATGPDPGNRFMSGYPAQLVGNALGLKGRTFCLDAACASSLYAIKLACDRLHSREADVMLAGGVNRADDLFIHTGFSVLQALSKSGRSRPFNREADGLVPAEGAAILVLKRLADAEVDGNAIAGVIRAVGLSNDGRSKGMLVPDQRGQVRAMRHSYTLAGLAPTDVSLIECHATGTAIGDSIEIESMSEVFSDTKRIPIGSLKSNLGHLITTSGAAALIKVMAAMEAGVKPPTLHTEPALDTLTNSPFTLLTEEQDWECDGPRRAAINNFGFGGNNAHLIVEQWQAPATPSANRGSRKPPKCERAPLAMVAIGACVGDGASNADFVRDLFAATTRPEGRTAISVEAPVAGLGFPPADLRQALPQQLMLLRAACEAVAQIESRPTERTGALVGMQCATEIARHGMRWRLPEWLAKRTQAGSRLPPERLQRARDEIIPALQPAGVIGTMPNILANRLNSAFDWQGPSYTVANEELSGVTALTLAADALHSHELDAVLVGAVDVCCEPVHEWAAQAMLPAAHHLAGDAAVALVLKRLADAKRDSDTVYATVAVDPRDTRTLTTPGYRLELGEHPSPLGQRFGHAHAASGLQYVAAAALACAAQAKPLQGNGAAVPWVAEEGVRSAEVSIRSFAGQQALVHVSSDSERPTVSLAHALNRSRLHVFSGADRTGLQAALERGEASSNGPAMNGPARLVIVCGPEQLGDNIGRAQELLTTPKGDAAADVALTENIYYRERPLGGDIAFMFTGAAAAYSGAGRDLMLALPEWVSDLGHRFPALGEFAATFLERDNRRALTAVEQLKSSSLLCQFHALLTRELLGLQPGAVLGLSSGESNALYAMGVWRDLSEMFAEIDASEMYGRYLTGRCETARTFWGPDCDDSVQWSNWRILAPLDEAEAALGNEPHVAVSVINAPDDCVIGGRSDACARVIERVGSRRAHPLGLDMVVHCREMAPFAERWRDIHRRAVTPVTGVRFYSNALAEHYQPDIDRTADALLAQALHPIDFRRTVISAWNDGARVFLEQGPRNSLSLAASKILGAREHVAIALDRSDRSGISQLLHAAAALIASGVDLDHYALNERLSANVTSPPEEFPAMSLRVQVHPPPPKDLLSSFREPLVPEAIMAPAPALAPVVDDAPNSDTTREPSPVAATSLRRPSPRPPARAPTEDPRYRILEEVSGVHRAFVRQQSELHQKFLALQQQSWPRPPPVTTQAIAEPPPPTPESVATPGNSQPTSFSRRQLEILAGGKISSVFGPRFEPQDRYPRQVRMPEPPLLLADRVTHLSGEPGSMGRGSIRTETDVGADAWYLQDGVMPPGIVIESGQADLLLISWLGADFLNKGERVYRLLGCELTFHEGGLPRAGDTLAFDIHIDGHARQGDVRLFFFHYDCHVGERLLLSVRSGQAGFFSDRDLAESGGVLWEPENDEPVLAQMPRAPCPTRLRRFSATQVQALADGDAYACFGAGFEKAATHQLTPRIGYGQLQMIGEVASFDPAGGPWGRGYLRAESAVSADDWYFKGHFKNDPCMPGTLMANVAVQTMAFYLAALGYTVDRDGWRFEPVTDEAFNFVCRGQVTPDNRQITYELFVEELVDTPLPTLYAAILCTSDGLKVFHCRRFGLQLVPDYPLASRQHLLTQQPPHYLHGDIRGDYDAVLACAWGAPSVAFGRMYQAYDGVRRIPRLPGPPFHFMSRIVTVDDPPCEPHAGAMLTADYEIPAEAWYFEEYGDHSMPFTILVEALLQPCGWFATYLGLGQDATEDLVFRNLDGDRVSLLRAIRPGTGTLNMRITLERWSKLGNTALVFFRVESDVAGQPALSFNTAFGFFSQQALSVQTGLPAGRSLVDAGSGGESIDLRARPARLFEGSLRLPGPKLLMLDEIVGYWPEGGDAGHGVVQGRQRIDPGAWYFKAHFFQDPVQPGSLGLEAVLQLLKCYMILRDCGRSMTAPRFHPVPVGDSFTWTYRGQVLPTNRQVDSQVEITRLEHDPHGITAVADGSLWVDGLRIFDFRDLAMRIVETDDAALAKTHQPSGQAASSSAPAASADTRTSVVPDDEQIRRFWRKATGGEHPLAEHIFTRLARRFVGHVGISDAETLALLRERPVLFLANHQNGIESVLFVYLVSVITGKPINAIAKSEHRDQTWLGQLIQHVYSYPDVRNPELLFYFRFQDPSSMLPLLERIHESFAIDKRSLLIHVEGGRTLSCREPVSMMSAFIPDLALKLATPIIPVRFVGGLPVEPLSEPLEYPYGFARQDIHLGRPLHCETLASLSIAQRKTLIAESINGVHVPPAGEEPNSPVRAFEQRVNELEARYGCHRSSAVVLAALGETEGNVPEIQHLLAGPGSIGDILPHSQWHTAFRDWLLNARDFED